MITIKTTSLKKILKCNFVQKFEKVSFSHLFMENRSNYSKSYNAMPLLRTTLEQEEFDKYTSHIHDIIKYLMTTEEELPKEGIQRLKNILSYNLKSHVQDTGPLVVSTYKQFAHAKKLTPESMNLVYSVGWAYDMVIRGYQMIDDIMDSSETRDNKPCWHQVENIGLKAVNDSVVLVEASNMILKKYLCGHPSYFPILKLTNETKYKIVLGQMIDVNFNLELFTIERWKMLAKYKGTFGGVIDPIVRGMYLAEVFDENLLSEITKILIVLGEYFTAQNDMLDCYGKSSITGKYGNDILEGRFTWLAVQALANANLFQRELFQKHYGKPNDDSQKIIKDMYSDLNIFKKFLMYEEDCYKKLNGMIENLPEAIPKSFMHQVIDAYYGKI